MACLLLIVVCSFYGKCSLSEYRLATTNIDCMGGFWLLTKFCIQDILGLVFEIMSSCDFGVLSLFSHILLCGFPLFSSCVLFPFIPFCKVKERLAIWTPLYLMVPTAKDLKISQVLLSQSGAQAFVTANRIAKARFVHRDILHLSFS